LAIRMFIEAEITLYVIAGNHDKSDLTADFSYLNVYEVTAQSDYFQLFSQHDFVDFPEQKVRLHFIPYYTEGEPYMEQLVEAIKFIDPKKKNILATHIAVNGVMNNDGSIVETGIPVKAFKKFDAVYCGHYHQYSHIPPNIWYLHGAYQQNFGEPEQMGFTLLAPDLTTTFHQSQFKKFKQLRVNATDKKALHEITTELAKIDLEEYNVRVKIVGSLQETKSLDVSQLSKLGVDVKFENNTEVAVDFEDVAEAESIVFNKSDLLKHYIKYAQEYGLNTVQRNEGLKRLKNI